MRELAGERTQTFERDGVIGQLPRRTQAALDDRAVAFGQVIEDVSLLVTDTALDRNPAEDRVDRGA